MNEAPSVRLPEPTDLTRDGGRLPAATRRSRYQSLDHWRGLACLFVVVYHSTMVHLELDGNSPASTVAGSVAAWTLALSHRLSVGVALFFVISGYCIAAAADSTRKRGGGVRSYFFRRFRRIYPPFWIIILCSAAFFVVDYWPSPGLLSRDPWSQLRPSWYSLSQWFGNVTLTETWRYHFFGSTIGHFPGQSWTLCYEEQFYAVTGLLLAISPASFFRGAGIVTVLTLVAVGCARMLSLHVDGFFFDGSWLLFAAGVAVFYRLHYAAGVRARFVEAVLLLMIPLSLALEIPVNGAAIGFCFAALLPLLHRFDDSISSATVLKPFMVCGQMCYSLYLVHQLPVKAVSAALHASGIVGTWRTLFITVPASVAVSLVLGWVFHILVERKFLNTQPAGTGEREEGDLDARRRAVSLTFAQ